MKKGRNTIVHFVPRAPIRLSEILQEHFHLKDEERAVLFDLGAIYLGGERLRADSVIPKGAQLQIYLKPKRYKCLGVDWDQRLIFENADFLILDKPGGIPVHSTNDNLTENVLYQLRSRWKKELLITHRLDAPVSGLLLLAKNSDFQNFCNAKLAERELHKSYTALVEKAPPLGQQVHYLHPADRLPKQISSEPKLQWLKCELKIQRAQETKVLGARVNFQVEIEPLTGRTHQIRAQMAGLGTPVLGDSLYGGKRLSAIPRLQIALCSVRLAWQGHGPKHSFELAADFKREFGLG